MSPFQFAPSDTSCIDDNGHFLYKAAPIAFSDEQQQAVQVIHDEFKNHPLSMRDFTIEVESRTFLTEDGRSAYKILNDAFPTHHDEGIVVCRNALPHNDDHMYGIILLSLVLRTGPSPYVILSMRERRHPNGRLALDTKEVLAEVGDIVILDPCRPHAAFPLESTRDSGLCMMQFSIDLDRVGGHAGVLGMYPPHKNDRQVNFPLELR